MYEYRSLPNTLVEVEGCSQPRKVVSPLAYVTQPHESGNNTGLQRSKMCDHSLRQDADAGRESIYRRNDRSVEQVVLSGIRQHVRGGDAVRRPACVW